MKLKLTDPMKALLREVAEKYNVQIEPLMVEADGAWSVTNSAREMLIEAISNEFSATGLRADSEPNERGLELEDLLDRVNRLR